MLEELLLQLEKIEGIVVTTLYHNDKITEIKISELERVSQWYSFRHPGDVKIYSDETGRNYL